MLEAEWRGGERERAAVLRAEGCARQEAGGR